MPSWVLRIDSIQHPDLLHLAGLGPKRLRRHLEGLFELDLQPCEILCGAAGREVVSVDCDLDLLSSMGEDAGTRLIRLEATAHQELYVSDRPVLR